MGVLWRNYKLLRGLPILVTRLAKRYSIVLSALTRSLLRRSLGQIPCTHTRNKRKTHLRWVCFLSFGCGGGIWTSRPPGYEPDELPSCSTPRYDSLKREYGADSRTRTGTGIASQRILSPWRLPIPPHRLISLISIAHKIWVVKCFFYIFFEWWNHIILYAYISTFIPK